MAPTKAPQAPYAKDERVLCFHHEMLYEAKVLDVRVAEDGVSWECKIHYKGWKATWDDWVPSDRVRKFTDENKALAQQLQEQMKALQQQSKTPAKAAKVKKGANGSDFSSARGSEERGSAVQQQRSARRMKEYDLEAEAEHNARVKVKVAMSDRMNSLLVDDWQNVTKDQKLRSLPAEWTIADILKEYEKVERPKRAKGSSDERVLDEVLEGLKEYFERAIGRILLYKFEREQYNDVRKNWNSANPDPEISGNSAIETYGVEHLARLLAALPELIAQTNMDAGSIKKMQTELNKLCRFIDEPENIKKLWADRYESPSQQYIDKASR